MSTLYVVATPIGNLEDITLRALRILKEVDLIACEDTRHTGKLLQHYKIKKPLLACHKHNERKCAQQILKSLKQGQKVAFVTDAGTPLVSDPGQILIAEVVEAGYKVEPVAGVSAVTTALSASGLSADQFVFEGFLPAKAKARQKRLEELKNETRTLVFYEAPHRLLKTVSDLNHIFDSQRKAVVARELTKMHEEVLRGSLEELHENLKFRQTIKGEIVILVAGNSQTVLPSSSSPEKEVALLAEKKGLSLREASKQIAKKYGLKSRDVYQSMLHKD